MMIKEIEIQGCVTVPEEVSMDDFIDMHLLKKTSGVLVAGIVLLSMGTT